MSRKGAFCLCQHKLLYSHYTKIISKAVCSSYFEENAVKGKLTFSVLKHLILETGLQIQIKLTKTTNLNGIIIRMPEFGFCLLKTFNYGLVSSPLFMAQL